MAIIGGKFIEDPEDWVIMQTPCTKEMVRCKRHKIPYLLSVGYIAAWDVYREELAELEKNMLQGKEKLKKMKKKIVELSEIRR